MNKFFSLILIFALLGASNNTFGQCTDGVGANGANCGVNTVFTSIPFLRINPDGRSGGMGDVGLATSADPASIYFNNSKLAFAEDRSGLAITYTPWLKALVPDMFIGHVVGYTQLDDLSAIGGSLRYFNMGSIQFTDANGQNLNEFSPHEFAIDLGYSRKLSQNVSTGLTLKYAYSNLAKGQVTNSGEITAATAVAADLSFYYQNEVAWGGQGGTFALGAAISNIGNKVSYTEDDVKDFIPTNLGIGAAYTMDIDDYNSLMFAFDVNKLMVPTPDSLTMAGDPEVFDHREKTIFEGMFGSFGDAPGGFGEEMRELMLSFGAEYWYNQQFAVRAGYFYEHQNKGNRQYVTLGLGLKYNIFGINFSYLVPTSSGTNTNPLENTLRFSLLFDLDDSNNK